MKIAVGSDHRGVGIKTQIVQILKQLGHEPDDQGTHSTESCDYPDFAHAVACHVAQHKAQRGILVCGTGIGMSMAANKTSGVRAALCHDVHSAEMSRRHNDANVLCLSADQIEAGADENLLREIVSHWLSTKFEGGRHQRRVEKIGSLPDAASCKD